MSGGTGADTFVFEEGHGDDTITDFDIANDKISLTRFTQEMTWKELQAAMTQVDDDAGTTNVDETATVIDLSAWGGGTITLQGVTATDLTEDNFYLSGAWTWWLYGDSDDNTIDGNRANNLMYGFEGDDTLSGQQGNDWIFGGEGADSLDGGAGNDVLLGGEGNDTLTGGAGEDLLIGGEGDDTLTGGGDADTFVFGEDSGDDTITDFDTTQDKIDLSTLAQTITWEQLQSKITAIADNPLTTNVDESGTKIDLSDWGGGTITLTGITSTDLTESMFRVLDDGRDGRHAVRRGVALQFAAGIDKLLVKAHRLVPGRARLQRRTLGLQTDAFLFQCRFAGSREDDEVVQPLFTVLCQHGIPLDRREVIPEFDVFLRSLTVRLNRLFDPAVVDVRTCHGLGFRGLSQVFTFTGGREPHLDDAGGDVLVGEVLAQVVGVHAFKDLADRRGWLGDDGAGAGDLGDFGASLGVGAVLLFLLLADVRLGRSQIPLCVADGLVVFGLFLRGFVRVARGDLRFVRQRFVGIVGVLLRRVQFLIRLVGRLQCVEQARHAGAGLALCGPADGGAGSAEVATGDARHHQGHHRIVVLAHDQIVGGTGDGAVGIGLAGSVHLIPQELDSLGALAELDYPFGHGAGGGPRPLAAAQDGQPGAKRLGDGQGDIRARFSAHHALGID